MFVAVIFILSLLLIGADWLVYKHSFSRNRSRGARWLVAAMFVGANILPYIAMLMMWCFDMSSMVPMMWLLTVYTVLSLSRLALYVGLLLIKNCYAKWLVGVSLCTIVAVVLLVGVVRTRKETHGKERRDFV